MNELTVFGDDPLAHEVLLVGDKNGDWRRSAGGPRRWKSSNELAKEGASVLEGRSIGYGIDDQIYIRFRRALSGSNSAWIYLGIKYKSV